MGSSQEMGQEKVQGWSVNCVLDGLLDIHTLLQLQATPRSTTLFIPSNSILQKLQSVRHFLDRTQWQQSLKNKFIRDFETHYSFLKKRVEMEGDTNV